MCARTPSSSLEVLARHWSFGILVLAFLHCGDDTRDGDPCTGEGCDIYSGSAHHYVTGGRPTGRANVGRRSLELLSFSPGAVDYYESEPDWVSVNPVPDGGETDASSDAFAPEGGTDAGPDAKDADATGDAAPNLADAGSPDASDADAESGDPNLAGAGDGGRPLVRESSAPVLAVRYSNDKAGRMLGTTTPLTALDAVAFYCAEPGDKLQLKVPEPECARSDGSPSPTLRIPLTGSFTGYGQVGAETSRTIEFSGDADGVPLSGRAEWSEARGAVDCY